MEAKLFHPKYWLLWFGLGLLRLSVYLPFSFNMWLGKHLGRLFYLFAKKRRHIAKVNIERCFPEESAAWQENILKLHFESLAKSLFETALSWWASSKKIAPLFHFHGIEHIQKAINKGKGVLILSAHFVPLEIGGRALVAKQKFGVMYRQHKNPVIEYVMGGSRRRHTDFAISRHDVRGLIKNLRKGNGVWYAQDQNSQRTMGVFAEFFGIPASTSSATARISKITGAAVVPFWVTRRQDDSGYDLIVEPALTDYPTGDLLADTQKINDLIEKWVRKCPSQYLWVHRRFRTRPQRGDKTFYE